MSIDKEKLKTLAEAANAVTTDVSITMAVGAAPEEVKAVQDYLQQAMPKTILALVAEIERLEKFEDWFVRLDQVEQSLSASFKAERDQLKAENQKLRETCARASACMDRWASGHRFDDGGPGGRIRDELYDAYRPGARQGIQELHSLINKERGQ